MAIFGRFGRNKESKRKDSIPAQLVPVLPHSNPAANLIQAIEFSPSPFAPPSPAVESTRTNGNPFVKVGESEGNDAGTTRDEAGESARRVEEEERLGRANLGVEDVTELVKLCSVEIRQRGLTTLGLFRPFRINESPDVIRKTCVLFLLHVETKATESRESASAAGRDPVGRELWKVSNLELFRENLAVARVEDVVCVLKWGLRHLTYRKTGFASASSPSSPLYWYTKFSLDPATQSSSSTAFEKILLPSLPASSKLLLLEILPLMQLILAQTDRNAMSLRRLSRTFGIYLFGLAGKDKAYSSWEEFYKIWNEAGEALEGCLKAYLRGQGGKLPARLREIRDLTEGGRQIKVVLVELESQGDWKKGSSSPSTSRGRTERRSPVEALRVAFEANEGIPGTGEEEREAHALWTAIKDSTQRKLDDPTTVLDDESRRIYKLLGLRKDPPPIIVTPFEPLAPLSSRGSPAISSVRASPVVPSPTLSSPTLTIKIERTPTWTEFASGGFTTDEPFDGKEFGFVKPSERPKPKSSGSKRSVRSDGAKSLKKMDYSPRSSPRSTVVSPPPLVPQPFSTILSIRIVEIEGEFPDFYSDSLGDGICSNWPSFLISELNSSIAATLLGKVNYLLLSDNLIPFRNSSTPHLSNSNPLSPVTTSNKATSSAKSFVSTSESTKRRFFSSGRMSGIFTSSLASKAKAASKSQLPPPLPPQTTATPPRPVRPVGELIKLESTPKREYISEFESPSTKPELVAVVTAAAVVGTAMGVGLTAGLVKSSSNAISVGDSLDSPSSIYDQIFQENEADEQEVETERPASGVVEREEEQKEVRKEEDVVWPPREDVERALARGSVEEDAVEEDAVEEEVVFAGIGGAQTEEVVEEVESTPQSQVYSEPSPVLDNIDDTPAIEEQSDDIPVLAEPISNPLESTPPEVNYIVPSPPASAPLSPDIPASSTEAHDLPPSQSDPTSIDSPENETVDSPSVRSPTPVLFTPIDSPSTNGSMVEEEESPIVGNIVPDESRTVPDSPLAQEEDQVASLATVQETIDVEPREIESVERGEETLENEPRAEVDEPAEVEGEEDRGLKKKVSVETLKGTEPVADSETVTPNGDVSDLAAPLDETAVSPEESLIDAPSTVLPILTPITPIKETASAPSISPTVAKSLFSKKSSESTRVPASPASTSSPKSTNSSSRKFLSGGLGNLLRRKKSTPKLVPTTLATSTSSSNVSKASAAFEERTQKDLRESEKLEKKREKVSTPKVVSSVRLRVEELEARKKKEREMATPTRLPKSASGATLIAVPALVLAPLPPPPSLPPPSTPLPAEPILSPVASPVEPITPPVDSPIPESPPALASPPLEQTPTLPLRSTDEISPTESTFSSMETDREEEGKVGLGLVNESVVSFASAAESQAHSFATAKSD